MNQVSQQFRFKGSVTEPSQPLPAVLIRHHVRRAGRMRTCVCTYSAVKALINAVTAIRGRMIERGRGRRFRICISSASSSPPSPPPSPLFSSFHSDSSSFGIGRSLCIPFSGERRNERRDERFYSFFALTLSGERRVTFVVLARFESSFSDDDDAAVPGPRTRHK